MSFDYRDIRRTMDVYTLDNAHLGMVLRVVAGTPPSRRGEAPEEVRQTGHSHGEAIGPVPTEALGNRGPGVQSPENSYGVTPDEAGPIGSGYLEVGKWWGARGHHSIPLDLVQTVSLERVVLKVAKDKLTTG